jgi:hypothetical protein
MTKPFNVESGNINLLKDFQLTQLLKILLHAEAFRYALAQCAVEVALNITTGDGGEDGRISWKNGVASTDYIPNRLTLFQNKATDMGPTDYGNEILAKDKTVKSQVDEVLSIGGSYVVFTTQELNNKQKKARIKKIRENLTTLGKSYASTCDLQIYDASQIQGWVNLYIPAIVAVQHWIGKPSERGLKTFDLWSEYKDLSSLPFTSVASRKDIITTLISDLPKPKSCFRVKGLSGLGKTRMAYQVFVECEEIRSLLVYVDANHAPNVDALVADWISLGLSAILVVDNCEYKLHERLAKEIGRGNSQISLLSLDYNFDKVSDVTKCFDLKQMSNDELLQLLNPIYSNRLTDLDRIVSFAQGFPQMAVLLAEARLNEDPRIGELGEDELANKLLWKRGEEENRDHLKILQVCSLFDTFGIEQEVEDQLKYIAGLVGLNVDTVYECIQKYSERGLIDRRGRYGEVVPKPLAIRLAGQWWTKTREQKQKELVNGIPELLIEGFCQQIEKMDFHPDVKLLTKDLCGTQGPFGQAEVILSNRGSRLFRSFVNVNPEATSAALYQTLFNHNNQQLLHIDGNIRRNLVWALEKLCFHANLFEESAWCLLLLASAENETWSNNATGIFSQLFRCDLSGTAADPNIRFTLLRKAFDLNRPEIDMVILNALEQATRINGGHRMVGAEYQGTKAPLQEWRPKIWQDIFDLWQAAFDLLLLILERKDDRKEKAMSIIGHSIRGFVRVGRIDMLDTTIKKVIEVNGKYWSSALESIKHTFEYDAAQLNQKAIDALNSWLVLLNPDDSDLIDKLKIIVITPPWEHHKDDDGIYIDMAAEKAKTLAIDIAKNVSSLFPLLDLLMKNEQKQSYTFGRQLAIELADFTQLLDLTLEQLVTIQLPNVSFALGLYSGIYEKSQATWQIYIDKLLEDKHLIVFYPDFIRTGKITKVHLDKLLELISENSISANSANLLGYGRVTDGIDPLTIAEFCLNLSDLGNVAAWSALNVIFMYCHSNKAFVKEIIDPLKKLVLAVSLSKDQKGTYRDIYHWHGLAQNILKFPDQEFAIDIVNQIIASCSQEFEYGDIWDYIKPLLTDLMQEYEEVLWPILGDAILAARGMERYWLQQVIDRENSFSNQQPSVLSVLNSYNVISWCKKNPDLGPNFIASCVNILETVNKVQQPTKLFIQLLENFGNDEKVVNALGANMATRGWEGSLVPYLEADKKALLPFINHHNQNVSKWVREYIAYIDRQIESESTRDEERNLGVF